MTKYITEYNGVQFMDKTGREKIKQLDTQYKDIAKYGIIFNCNDIDCSQALQEAVSSLENGSTFIIPSGEFKISNTIKFENKSNIIFECHGKFNVDSVDTESNVFSFLNCENILIKELKLYSVRDKTEQPPEDHTRGTTLGSNRIGLFFGACKNITISNPIFESMSTDIKIASHPNYPNMINKNIVIDNIISTNASIPIYISNAENIKINVNKMNVAENLGGGDHFIYINIKTKGIYINGGEYNSDNKFGAAFNVRTKYTSMGNQSIDVYDDSNDPKDIFISNTNVNSRSFVSAKATTNLTINNCYFNGLTFPTEVSSPKIIIQEEYSKVTINNSSFVTPGSFLFTAEGTFTEVNNSRVYIEGQLVQVLPKSINAQIYFNNCNFSIGNDATYYCSTNGICDAVFINCTFITKYGYVFSKRNSEGFLKVSNCIIKNTENKTNVLYNNTTPSQNIIFMNTIIEGYEKIQNKDDTGTIISIGNIINNVPV